MNTSKLQTGGACLTQPVRPGTIGCREDYERDVVEAQARYDANPSSMNHEDLYAAERALRRHWPNARSAAARDNTQPHETDGNSTN